MRVIWAEFIGLFVDDEAFAVAIIAWLVLAGLLLPRLGLPAPWPAMLLFAGFVVVLVESTLRRARKGRAKPSGS